MPEITPRSISTSARQHLIEHGFPPALAKIFAARGITDNKQLDTSLAALLPFDSLKNAREMARLLADAIAAKKKILVIADYDADGATACAIAIRGLRTFGAMVDFIVPNRFEYGYGLTPEIVQLAARQPLRYGIENPFDGGEAAKQLLPQSAGYASNGHGKQPPQIMKLAMPVSPHLNPLPQAGEEANERLREFHSNVSQLHPDILLTVDNGIASVDGVHEARRLGMEVYITDHHLPGDTLPDAACIVNPNQPGCHFPSKNLAGVGVMFYVLLALRAELRTRGAFLSTAQPPPSIPPCQGGGSESPPLTRGGREGLAEPRLVELLDLVALGTIADVVKLDQNNRILVQQGLQRIRSGRACAGINALLQVAKKAPAKVFSIDLGFTVGPRLNAAGRLDDMSLGINCLLSDEVASATSMAAKLDSLNRERRSIETDMQDSALATLESVNPQDNFSISLFDETWHQGVIGILASRLKDKFHRPVIIFAQSSHGELKGSGRSIAGLHLRDALDLISKRHPLLIRKFGGHAAAAGLSINADDFAAFAAAFEQVSSELLSTGDLLLRIETDGGLDSSGMNLEMAHMLDEQVWGQGFPAPQFDDDFMVENQRVVGEKHLKLRLSRNGKPIDAILFGYNQYLPNQIHAVYSLSVNEYNGSQSLQLIIRHWKKAG